MLISEKYNYMTNRLGATSSIEAKVDYYKINYSLICDI